MRSAQRYAVDTTRTHNGGRLGSHSPLDVLWPIRSLAFVPGCAVGFALDVMEGASVHDCVGCLHTGSTVAPSNIPPTSVVWCAAGVDNEGAECIAITSHVALWCLAFVAMCLYALR